MENISGVIFDMDGLIFDTEQLYYQGTQTIADRMDIPFDKATYLRFVGVSDEELWRNYHVMYKDFGKETVEEFIHDSYHEVLRLFREGKVDKKPGVDRLLAYLNERKIPKLIASSNKREVIELLLGRSGLDREFDTIVCAEDVANAKPDPEIFEIAAGKLATAKEETLILEDSDNGVIAAGRAGIPVIMIPDLIPPSAELRNIALRVFDSLEEVPKFLEKK